MSEKSLLNKLGKEIKDYSHLCRKFDIKELTAKDFDFLPYNQRIKSLNYHRIKTLEEFFNEGHKFNWADYNENKYYPYFIKDGHGGWRFYDSCCYCSCSSTAEVAYYRSIPISDFVGKKFMNIYIGLIE